jgi:low molecular weight protein-tyrosine phosphatase
MIDEDTPVQQIGRGLVRMTDVKLLFVCTGNTCRSPMAEGVLRHKLAAEGLSQRVGVASAGLAVRQIGGPPDPRAVARASLRGYDLTPLRGRAFETSDYYDFDLILAMDRGHMAAIGEGRPEGARARLHLFLDFAPAAVTLREVPDPYRGGLADYDRALDLIEPGVDGLIAMLKRTCL